MSIPVPRIDHCGEEKSSKLYFDTKWIEDYFDLRVIVSWLRTECSLKMKYSDFVKCRD